MKETNENAGTTPHIPSRYNEDAVDDLIEAAVGVGRILQAMSYAEERENFAQSMAHHVMFDQLWRAVKGVTGKDPMEMGQGY